MINVLTLFVFGQGKIGTSNVHLLRPNPPMETLYKYEEPQAGYLSSFKWQGEIPVQKQTSVIFLPPGKKPVEKADPYEKVTNAVTLAMKNKGIPGAAVALIANDQIVYSRGFGFANLSNGYKFGPTTPSRCGSISKTATALAVLRLAELGKLSLDDTLVSILQPIRIPGKKDYKSGWEKIRVRDLLDQSSGITSNSVYLTSHSMAEGMKKTMRLSLGDLYTYSRKNTELTGVKTNWAYCNLNFELASLVIERKTGKTFGEALTDLVVKPLGIPTTQMFLSSTRKTPPPSNVIDINNKTPEARYYQKSTQMLESIYEKDKNVPEAYGGLDGDILSGAGHIAFSAEAIARMVITLRTRPTTFLKRSLWNEVINKPAYVSSLTPNFNDNYYYSKGTWVSHDTKTDQYWFQHGAMLMHAAGNYGPSKGYEVVVIANSNSASGTLHDSVLMNAITPNLPKL